MPTANVSPSPKPRRIRPERAMMPNDIRKLRKGLRLTQGELAELLGVNWTTVARWEQGGVIPSPRQCELLRAVQVAGVRDPDCGKKLLSLLTAHHALHALLYVIQSAVEDMELRQEK